MTKILGSLSNCFGYGTNTDESTENLLAPRYNPLHRFDPKSYVRNVEQYFKRDPVPLFEYLMTEVPEAQTALLLHSDLLRWHLNLKDPNGFKYKYLPSSPVPPIQPHLAPKAYALAVTLLTQATPEKSALALTRFDELLQKHPPNRQPAPHPEYLQSVEKAFLRLLAQFQHLATDDARHTVLNLIHKHFGHLPDNTRTEIQKAMQPLKADPAISEAMKEKLTKLASFD